MKEQTNQNVSWGMKDCGEFRLHRCSNGKTCDYCTATKKDIKSGKAGSCEDYECLVTERRNNN